MWAFIAACLISAVRSSQVQKLFQPDQIIFASDFNITKLLVPARSMDLVENPSELSTIFFTVADPLAEGGSIIYVLQGLTLYEVLEGGRDTTADYSMDSPVFFGARNGIYKYHPETLSAKKFGPFQDDIIQIQKANDTDLIYILTVDNELYTIGKNGTTKERVGSVQCASEFVLDTSNNIYYLSCDDYLPYIVGENGTIVNVTNLMMEDFKEIKLLRPAFMMENSVPFIGDGNFYILYSNGTGERKVISLNKKPSAYSVDAAVYVIAALDGKIYEFNMMDMVLKSMFGPEGIDELTGIIVQLMEKPKQNHHGYPNIYKYI